MQPLQIACVGDSITAGYKASNASTAYPGVLQRLFNRKYGPGAYEVHNFGAGGATVQRHADSPYWNRTQYKSFVSGKYDVVILMLGTNDAKDKGDGGAPNWNITCNDPDPHPSTCPLMRDYLALIDVARTRGVSGKQPLVVVARPPPLWSAGAYGMNETVLNDIMPPLVTSIARVAGLPSPIDVYGALGGTKDWREKFPVCGCQRSSVPTNGSNYTLAKGFLGANEDYLVSNFTWSEAVSACDATSECAGFTFRSDTPKPPTPTHTYLKRCANTFVPANGWWTWTKPRTSPLSQPPSCDLFCDEQACDACHPNDRGYAVLARSVFEFLETHW